MLFGAGAAMGPDWRAGGLAETYKLQEAACQTVYRTQRKMTDKLSIQVDSLKFPALLKVCQTHYVLWAEDGALQNNFG